jgi:hypothetical protein
MARQYSSISVETTLASGMSNNQTTLTVATGTGSTLLGGASLPAGNVNQFTLAIDPDTTNEEIVFATAIAADTFTIVRGRAGSSNVSHSGGATVRHVLTSDDLTAFAAGISPVTNLGFAGSTSGTTTIQAAAVAGTNTLTLPATTSDTLVGKATTDTLTNKTLTSPTINTATIANSTLSAATLTGTLTAGGGVGTSGQVLKSTGTGVQWAGDSGGSLTEVVFTSSNATYTIPSGVTGFWALCVGAGGGGGSSSTATSLNGGGGGGAGQAIEKFIAISGDTTLNITVPAGGAGGTSGSRGSNGSAATIVGNTSSTTYLSAAGGGGGGGGAAANVSGASGASGGGWGSSTSYQQMGGGGGAGSAATDSSVGMFDGKPSTIGGGASGNITGVTGYSGGGPQGTVVYGGQGITIFGRAVCGGGTGGADNTGVSLNFGTGLALQTNNPVNNSTANTGAGGNGSSTSVAVSRVGGNGGSGLVILRYVI